jgi:hypothetical protein
MNNYESERLQMNKIAEIRELSCHTKNGINNLLGVTN